MKVNYKASTRKMDKGTFGDFKSAVNLASILSEKDIVFTEEVLQSN